jgi:uncharacterized protein YdhG (YjbR/CyaY superfamily)
MGIASAKTDFQSIDAYIVAQPEVVQPALRQVREVLREALPEADEVISYQIPSLRLNGRNVLHFAGYKCHYAIYPLSAGMLEAFREELGARLSGKATARFAIEEEVPGELIRRMAVFRAEEVGTRKGTTSKR